jgi:hypothetical protein
VRIKPGPLVLELVGWCCRLGTVTRVVASNCAAPGRWFAKEEQATGLRAPCHQMIRPPALTPHDAIETTRIGIALRVSLEESKLM